MPCSKLRELVLELETLSEDQRTVFDLQLEVLLKALRSLQRLKMDSENDDDLDDRCKISQATLAELLKRGAVVPLLFFCCSSFTASRRHPHIAGYRAY